MFCFPLKILQQKHKKCHNIQNKPARPPKFFLQLMSWDCHKTRNALQTPLKWHGHKHVPRGTRWIFKYVFISGLLLMHKQQRSMFSIHGIHKAASTIGISILLLHTWQKNRTQETPPAPSFPLWTRTTTSRWLGSHLFDGKTQKGSSSELCPQTKALQARLCRKIVRKWMIRSWECRPGRDFLEH